MVQMTAASKWEYTIMPIGDPDDADSPFSDNALLMNTLGQLGWELVGVYHKYMVFKRHVKA